MSVSADPAGREERPPVRSSTSDAATATPAAAAGSRLPYHVFRAAQQVVRVLPRGVSYALGAAGAQLLARARPQRFEGLRANLRQVMPDANPAAVERVLRRNVGNVARCWVDVMEMPYRQRQVMQRLDIIDGLPHFTAASERGRGVVVVSLHFGNWETGLAAWNGIGGDLALLAEQVQPIELFERIADARRSLGVRVIPLDAAAMRSGDPAAARRVGANTMREVLKQLRSGNVIAIAMDRDITGTGVELPFFGRPAPIPLGTVDVAIRAGAAIVPITLKRSRQRVHCWVHPEVKYDAQAPRDAEVRRVAEEVLRLFEITIREHPDMWHVLEPIWSDQTDVASTKVDIQ